MFSHIKMPRNAILPEKTKIKLIDQKWWIRWSFRLVEIRLKNFDMKKSNTFSLINFNLIKSTCLFLDNVDLSCFLWHLVGIDAVKGAATGVEEYNPRTNEWIQVTTMETRRLQFGVAVVASKLYVTGKLLESLCFFHISKFIHLCISSV